MIPETDEPEVLVPNKEDVGVDPVPVGPAVIEALLPVG